MYKIYMIKYIHNITYRRVRQMPATSKNSECGLKRERVRASEGGRKERALIKIIT